MNLIRKGKSRRGVIGVESAIVMIAFVIVAAALAFVVLNMGFSATQKAKTAIVASLDESSSTMEIAGKVTGSGSPIQGKLNVTAVPLKLAAGGTAVNLNVGTMAVKYYTGTVQYDNIYAGILTSGSYQNLTTAMDAAKNTGGWINVNPVTGNTNPNATKAVVYFSVNRNNNAILDDGEHAVLAIIYRGSERPQALDAIKAETVVPTGPPLSIERDVPNITSKVVDLG